ncbi:MAG: hypothetical protein A2148_05160 [Chloroflexi bacterium RBG_16_68_14]|nr:MAG: hypothetical protein A2148_05160 [Chloroflexi bacterium RBG_16_68_14]
MQRDTALAGAGIALIVIAAACGGGATTRSADDADGTPTPPRPQERAYRLVRTLESATFGNMLALALIPGQEDEAVVATQGGVIWRVSLEGDSPPVMFGDISDHLVLDPGLEEGLLGLAFSPGFESDGRVFLYYTAGVPGNRRSVISRFLVRDGTLDPATEQVVLEVPQPYRIHNGGQIAFGPDGYLYVGLGDGGASSDTGQDLSTLLGSILRLDVSGDGYEIPPDNPFIGVSGARPEIYAYGLRNPWRFNFDSETGDLWAADVGADTWEETARIVAGGNYGWDILEGFECFESFDCDAEGLLLPRSVYGHDAGCSVTGGYVYRGSALPELVGWYVYGDFCSGNVWAVDTADETPPVLLAKTGFPIASWGELPDGELVAVTFANAIYRLERAAPEP